MSWKRTECCIIVLSILFIGTRLVKGQACEKDTTIGQKNTEDKDDDDLDGTGFNAVLCTDKDFEFDCCGFIKRWEVYARENVGTPIDVTAQVWEDTGTEWTLIGENIVTVTDDDNKNQQDINNGNRIRVFNGQHVGFYEHMGSVITYGGGSSKKTTFTGPETTYDWDAIVVTDGRDYGIHARVAKSEKPYFTNIPDTVVLTSNAGAGDVLITLSVGDDDLEDAGQLVITRTADTGSAASFFTFNSVTNEVSISGGVILTPGDHKITFSVTDLCGRSNDDELTIRVLNRPPVINNLPNDTTISEDLDVRTLLHTLITSDGDGHSVSCSLDTTGVPFVVQTVIGSSDYGIYFDASATMDYYVQNAYILTISCTDGTDSTTGEFTVNLILNQPPVINLLPLAVDISEDINVDTWLYTFSVTDPENATVICTVPTITPITNYFYPKPSTKFNEWDIMMGSGANFDYDVIRLYRLDISCTDERRSDTNVFFVNLLRNQPPVFVNLQNVTAVSGPDSHIGQIVFDVEVTDPTNDQVQYSMTCVPSTSCPFTIYDSGTIILTRSLQGEFTPAYDLYVYVTDGKTTVGPRTLTVHILNINYVPVITNLPLPSALVVAENSVKGSSVFQVSIQDRDRNDTHAYTMVSTPSTGMLYFEINTTTGLIRTSPTTNINYEDILPTTAFTLTVTVTDYKDSTSEDLTISIVDVNEPVLFTKKSYVLSTPEGPAGTPLTDPGYLFTDEDVGDTHSYSLVCAGYFSINRNTGLISITSDLDVDEAGLPTSYACSVIISDGTVTDTASLVINVNNINDNTPLFSSNLYTYYVDINTGINTVIGSTVATDGDKGAFGTFTYSIDQSSIGSETFGIQANGDVYLKTPLSTFGYGQSLRFTVLATDSGWVQGTATVFVVIPQTTTTTTTTTDKMVTFIEYPANAAWLVVACVAGMFSFTVPCIMIYKNWKTCTWRGRPGQSFEETFKDKPKKNKQSENHRSSANWNPWRWFEIRHQ